jgi:hypothetical protein
LESETYGILNKDWKTTCRMIFGREIGELEEYEDYLREGVAGKKVESCFSGKKLWVASEHYSNNARFFDFSTEQKLASSAQTGTVDGSEEDVDSLVGKIKEQLIYGGNKVFGNSQFSEDSDGISDSTYILGSSLTFKSTHQAYTLLIQKGGYTFGSTSSGESSHIIRCFYINTHKRCFECCTAVGLSDCMFCYNVMSSSNCMFSFNLKAKQYVIGNVQLDKEQYFEAKERLVSEIADELEKKKRLGFSIIDIVNGEVQ